MNGGNWVIISISTIKTATYEKLGSHFVLIDPPRTPPPLPCAQTLDLNLWTVIIHLNAGVKNCFVETLKYDTLFLTFISRIETTLIILSTKRILFEGVNKYFLGLKSLKINLTY